MMASNRFRLRHLAQSGHHGAEKSLALLNQTNKMLGVILLGNNLVNSAAATLVSVIAIELFGEEKWALAAGTLIVTFANFDIVRVLTAGGPVDQTHVFATWAFKLGIESSDLPLGAAVSLFMFPILAIAAIFILRDINQRGNEA